MGVFLAFVVIVLLLVVAPELFVGTFSGLLALSITAAVFAIISVVVALVYLFAGGFIVLLFAGITAAFAYSEIKEIVRKNARKECCGKFKSEEDGSKVNLHKGD